MAAKRLHRLNGFWLLSVLIGVLLLVSISFYSANTDIATAEDALSTRVDYIKEQCADYSSLNLASEAKSLLRVTESAQQCAGISGTSPKSPTTFTPLQRTSYHTSSRTTT